jgi:Spy/CpxP family protein refolding chaperone
MALGATGLLTWSAAVVAAQTPTTKPSSNVEAVANYLTDRLKTELNLTPEQIPKVKAIGVKGATELEKLIDKYEGDTTAASDRALVRGLVGTMQTSQAELKQVLTPEQWTQHQANRAQRFATNQTEIMAYTLNLSRQQILDVGRINTESSTKLVKALEQPAGAPKRTQEETLAALQPYFQERDAQLEKVLTVPQWKEMQENRRALRDLFVEQAEKDLATAKPPKS